MTSHKRRAEHGALFGISASRPEWEVQRDEARKREMDKTQRLRAARLAAQAKPAESAPSRVAPKSPSKKVLRAINSRAQ